MKPDLSDFTFTIPFFQDSTVRLDNLRLMTELLHRQLWTNVTVGIEWKEYGMPPMGIVSMKNFVKYYDAKQPWFHRTKVLNDLAQVADTPFIVNCDADLILPTDRYIQAAELIRSGSFEMLLPYTGSSQDVSYSAKKRLVKGEDPKFLLDQPCKPVIRGNSVGGMIFWNREVFLRIGGENEHFKAWGYEDNERLVRAKKLGVSIKRLEGPLFHLPHPHTKNTGPRNQFAAANQAEFQKVSDMAPDELRAYIKTWPWATAADRK